MLEPKRAKWVAQNRSPLGGLLEEWLSIGDTTDHLYHAATFTDQADCQRFCDQRNAESAKYNAIPRLLAEID